MTKEMDDLTNAVNDLETAVTAATGELKTLAQALRDASGDSIAVEGIASRVHQLAVDLEAATSPAPAGNETSAPTGDDSTAPATGEDSSAG